MSRTDGTEWRDVAGALFDDVLVPLASARDREGAPPYFPRHGDERASTYFVEPDLPTMRGADFEPHDGDAASLVDALINMWAANGESELGALGPPMRRLAELLADESTAADSSVDPLCYTLF